MSLRVVSEEVTVARAESALDQQTTTLQARTFQYAPIDQANLVGAVPRALLADALFHARSAQGTSDRTKREALLQRAADDIVKIRDARPFWGEMWSTATFIQSMREGADNPSVRDGLDRSYFDAPYLSRAAGWRVAYGLSHWSDLHLDTRDHVLNEAVWLSRSSHDSLDQVMALARQSPAYRQYLVRWIESRQGDADFRSIQRLTP